MKTSLFFKQAIGALVIFSILFLSAGHFLYWQGLVFTIIGISMFVLNFTILSLDEELMKERSKPGKGVKKWDKPILGLSFLVTISMYIVAGLDTGRYHWSPPVHWAIYALGIILTASGQLLFLIAQKENKFFSSIVRIQTDRNHTVCDTGLYKFVRHPAYFGSLLQAVGFPMLFGSLFSITPTIILIFLVILRTVLEDKTLQNELVGYTKYSNKVKYKIIPLIW